MNDVTPTSPRVRKLQWALLALIVLVGAVLRFGELGLMEFKGDEAVAVALAVPMVEGEALPRVGLMSSVGVHNPPLFIWLTALPMVISTDPAFITGALVGVLSVLSILLGFVWFRRRFGAWTALFAMALYACGTWPVLYARKIWAQNVLPLFSLATLHILFLVWERPKTRWIAAGPVLLCALWQIHFSAFAIILLSLGLCLVKWRQLNWGWLAAGTAAALLLFWPYLDHQRKNEWQDVQGMRNIASGKRADGTTRETPKKWTTEPVTWAAYVAAGTKLDYALGHSTEPFQKARSGASMAGFAQSLGNLLLAVGALGLVGMGLFGLWRRRRGDLPPAGHAGRVILAWWVFGYLALFLYVRLEHVYPHYFTMLLPTPFFVMAFPLGALADRFGWRGALASGAVVAFLVTAHLVNLGSFRTFLKDHGGTQGDYGVVYEAKDELTSWMVTHGREYARVHGWEFGFMLNHARKYGDLEAMAAAVADRPAPPEGRKRVNVYNTLWQHGAVNNRCPGRQDFGPLVVCPVR